MIRVEKLNHAVIWLNPDSIRSVERTGDTVITFRDGEQLVVIDTPESIEKKIMEFLLAIHPPAVSN